MEVFECFQYFHKSKVGKVLNKTSKYLFYLKVKHRADNCKKTAQVAWLTNRIIITTFAEKTSRLSSEETQK
ncbi:hypothetical protein SAMN05660862_1826 [Sphingobacterium psychroaquaticum]|uniref:Uncharacterized protein n=1 Tax=Sphingobacterium psychroaquaticum TaxID=561061 RepID=A0A1X7JMJ9_9SPHI|nr:hypothetical protein SAMN05660862_1826 [Sphingobacterium psychroaquaticum]